MDQGAPSSPWTPAAVDNQLIEAFRQLPFHAVYTKLQTTWNIPADKLAYSIHALPIGGLDTEAIGGQFSKYSGRSDCNVAGMTMLRIG